MNISIIITTYNAAQYIVETLQSIVQQTYSNFEIVIIDDGSIDNTLQIIREFMENYHQIDLQLISMQHIGRALALNQGVSHAKHGWIAIIDADDVWHVKKLEIQVQYIKKYNLDFLATDADLFFENEKVEINSVITKNNNDIAVDKISLEKMLCTNVLSHSAVLFKKQLAKYDETRRSQIDYELWLRLLQQGQSLYFLREKLAFHRVHSNQLFESRNRLRYVLNTALLQLKYCFRNFKILAALYVVAKLGYYFFLPKKMRLKVREHYKKMWEQKKCVE